ncbi:hypothetical protein TUM4438_46750 [Shewanella sairae]|uniref:Transposase n=1 Tax=Shewanella sairae TaxID=190310 RepID=A0ABQ4NU39_9GAMM|nr:hypothetical protein TUM4438_46750 [Shewanella sairae]
MGFVLRLSKRCPSRNPSYIDRLHCNDADTDLVSGTKVSPLPAGLPLQENWKNFVNRETQMMTSIEVSASPCFAQLIIQRLESHRVESIKASSEYCKGNPCGYRVT